MAATRKEFGAFLEVAPPLPLLAKTDTFRPKPQKARPEPEKGTTLATLTASGRRSHRYTAIFHTFREGPNFGASNKETVSFLAGNGDTRCQGEGRNTDQLPGDRREGRPTPSRIRPDTKGRNRHRANTKKPDFFFVFRQRDGFVFPPKTLRGPTQHEETVNVFGLWTVIIITR